MAAGGEARPVLIHSPSLLRAFDSHPTYQGRAGLVQSLISAYELDKTIRIVQPKKTDWSDLLTFHSEAFVEFIRSYGNRDSDDLSPSQSEEADLFGLNYDCPLFEGLSEFVLATAASSLTAAEVVGRLGGVAINWYGGWHHAHRDEASGYCYVNDIVLSILHLLEYYPSVLYVDMDIHHGDGVEEAFYHSPRVMTVSFHKQAPGFFPGSGEVTSTGSGPGQYYTINVPLRDGLRDKTFHKVFTRVLSDVKSCFQPAAVVVQCGADMLSEDPIGTFSLTPRGMGDNVAYILGWKLPTVLLGGGGYNFPNTAKFWAICTGLVAGQKLTNEIPEHSHYESYSPDFDLSVTPSNRSDENTDKYIDDLLATISAHLSNN